ncbi:hypothetical protein AWENTII_006250 [Aspergillus wentii]
MITRYFGSHLTVYAISIISRWMRQLSNMAKIPISAQQSQSHAEMQPFVSKPAGKFGLLDSSVKADRLNSFSETELPRGMAGNNFDAQPVQHAQGVQMNK